MDRRTKTEILDLMSRKLSPFMFLFGFYLLSHGHLSPGGGFQAGVVIASGVILLALSQGVSAAEKLFPLPKLAGAEAVAFVLLLAAGTAGVITGVGFLGNPAAASPVPRVAFILLLNTLIGVKVGVGVSIICMHLFREE